jgi:acyl dehydratase
MSYLEIIHEYVGKDVGTSPWISIDQAKINTHANTTGDDSWIHTNPDRAAAETPFGGTIVQGFLLLAQLTEMAKSLTLPTDGVAYSLNYGLDRVRIVQPVPVDSRIRGHFELKKVESKGHHGVLAYLDVSIEIEGDDIAPAMVAEWLAYMRLKD